LAGEKGKVYLWKGKKKKTTLLRKGKREIQAIVDIKCAGREGKGAIWSRDKAETLADLTQPGTQNVVEKERRG